MPRTDLYLCAHADPEHHQEVVTDFVTPLARSVRERPELHSLFFVRMNLPTWQVRLRAAGDVRWLHGPYLQEAEERLRPLVSSGVVTEVERTHYQREIERYGGEEGMELAEKIFHHDSLACLEWMELERNGELQRNRRELALLMAERYADLLGLEGTERARFYHFGYRWTRDMGTWDEADFEKLEARYRQIAPAMHELLQGEASHDPETLWGGAASARIARDFFDPLRPLLTRVVAGFEAGRIRQHLAYLGWSYTHLPCNRLGLPPLPEAILRYLQHRYHQEHNGLPGPEAFADEPPPTPTGPRLDAGAPEPTAERPDSPSEPSP